MIGQAQQSRDHSLNQSSAMTEPTSAAQGCKARLVTFGESMLRCAFHLPIASTQPPLIVNFSIAPYEGESFLHNDRPSSLTNTLLSVRPRPVRPVRLTFSLSVQVGGDEHNVAVDLARLGRDTAYISLLPQGPLGAPLRAPLSPLHHNMAMTRA